ncbi:M56 family metallopeptidase [Epilithonimonas caeni]|uniref:M56 family metallopeptidase n=1 Tax=Epilithonimonas caeni TaxID=365343 RepID=UPI000684A3BC|nr:M56 family metallopeptidase [Epilithonimonas caeni]
MEPMLLYFGKMILCSTVMFAYYLLFLKDKTFHHYNRFYLLLSVIISLVLPLIKVSYFTIETNKNLYLLLSQLNQNQLQTTTDYDITIYSVFYTVIGVVSIILLIRLIVGILRIQSIKKQFPNETIEGIKFYQTNLNNAPFSFFRNLFWKQSIQLDSPVGQQILKHEMVHIQQKHSWDKLLMQMTKSVFWFNPVFYFINKEINLIHEYLADKKAVKRSDTKAFAQMLLESHFSGSVLPVTSPFLSSNLKKRLTMITKNQTKYSYARKLFALPILFFMVFAYMVNAKNKEIKETNKAIEIAVKKIKMDTIRPKFDSLVSDHKGQTKAYSEALQEDHLKMSAISKKMAEKSKALSALKKAKKEDSPEYKALENEMESLAAQMDDVVNSDNYRRNIKGLEEHSEEMARMYDSPEFRKRISDADKVAKNAEAMVNSPEFRKRIADADRQAKIAERMMRSPKFQKNLKNAQEQAEKMQIKINSPEFQKMIQDAQKKAQEASEQYGKIYSEAEFQKLIKDQYGKDSFTDGTVAYGFDLSDFPEVKDLTTNFNFKFSDDNFFNEAKSKLSPKELKKMEKKRKQLQEKQKELMEEQKKLQEKQRELNKEMRQNNPWTISFNSNLDSPKALVYNKDITPPQRINRSNQVVVLDKSLDNTTVYINGKKVDRSELQKVEPSTISSVNVFKTNGTGKIEVTTK